MFREHVSSIAGSACPSNTTRATLQSHPKGVLRPRECLCFRSRLFLNVRCKEVAPRCRDLVQFLFEGDWLSSPGVVQQGSPFALICFTQRVQNSGEPLVPDDFTLQTARQGPLILGIYQQLNSTFANIRMIIRWYKWQTSRSQLHACLFMLKPLCHGALACGANGPQASCWFEVIYL